MVLPTPTIKHEIWFPWNYSLSWLWSSSAAPVASEFNVWVTPALQTRYQATSMQHMEYNEEHTYSRFMTQEDNLLFPIPIYGLLAKYLLLFTPRVIVLMWHVHKNTLSMHRCMDLFSAFWPETSGKQAHLTATTVWVLEGRHSANKILKRTNQKTTTKKTNQNNNNNKHNMKIWICKSATENTTCTCKVHSRASQITRFPRAAGQEHRHAGHPPARTCSWLELSSRKQVIKQSPWML